MQTSIESIRDAFTKLRRDGKMRHRDIAEQLHISEGELIAAHVGAKADDANIGFQAIRLTSDWPAIISAIESLGVVMALTRNASCVHEKTGVYRHASHTDRVGLVLGGDIDLRIFYQHWAHGFAVIEQTAQGLQQSLQFYDASGTAIHKVFMKAQSDAAAYQALLARYMSADQTPGAVVQPPAPPALEAPDDTVDVAGFRRAWSALRDTHDFFAMLKSFGVSRTQALRLADPKFVQPVDTDDCQSLLQAAASERVSIMVFVGNPGMIQIHGGPIKKVVSMGSWVNVLDPGFNLHLREDHIASAWVVKKPTVDGLVTSLEIFDAQGQTIAMVFGTRKPGQPELCEWRALIENIQQEPRTCLT
jgi:putative hemin transport protein